MDQIKAYYHEACRSEHMQTAQQFANDIQASAKANPRSFLYGSIFVLATIWLFFTAVARLRRKALPSTSRPQTPDPEKKAQVGPPGGFKFAMQTPGGKK